MNRVFVTSDTHGCADRLAYCLSQAHFDYQNDKLIHLGDVVDRGKDSKGVVDLLLGIKNLVAIKGNHDHWWLQYLVMRHQAPHIMSHMTQGGIATVESYLNEKGQLEVPQEHEDFFKRQLLHYEDEQGRFFTHAGYDRMQKIEDQEETVFSWDRELMREAIKLKDGENLPDVNDFKRVFIGHTATTYYTEEQVFGPLMSASAILDNINAAHPKRCTLPIYKGNIVDVDTGGCYGGKISLLDITDDDNHYLFQA